MSAGALVAGGVVLLLLAIWRAQREGRPIKTAHAGALALPLMYPVPATSASYTLFTLLPIHFVLAELRRERAKPGEPLIAAALIGVCQTPLTAWVLRGGPVEVLTPVFSLSVVALAALSPWLVWRRPALEPAPGSESDGATSIR